MTGVKISGAQADTGVKRINRYGLAGFGYAALGMSEAFVFQTVPGDLSVAAIEAAIIGTVVGIPAALLTFRHSIVSAVALALLASVNAIGSGFAAANGEPYFTAGSVIINLAFLACFARGVISARRMRRGKALASRAAQS